MGFWYLCGPLILYWVVDFVAQLMISIGFSLTHMTEITKNIVWNANMTEEQLMEAAQKMQLAVQEMLQTHQVEISGAAALCTIALSVFLISRDRKRANENSLFIPFKVKAHQYVWILMLGFALCVGANSFMVMSQLAFASQGYIQVSQIFYSAGFVTQILCLGLIMPVSEELMFRGLLFQRLRGQVKFRMAAIFSSLLFAFSHGNIVQLLYTFCLGMFLAYVYEKYGSLKAPVLLHITVNMVSLVGTKVGFFYTLFQSPAAMAGALVAGTFVAAVMFVMIRGINNGKIEITIQIEDQDPEE